jgi:hypothetical protein
MADRLDFFTTTTLAISNHGWFVKDHALTFYIDKGVGCTKVDCHVAGKPVEEASEHFSLAILSLFFAMIRNCSSCVVPLHDGQIKAVKPRSPAILINFCQF